MIARHGKPLAALSHPDDLAHFKRLRKACNEKLYEGL